MRIHKTAAIAGAAAMATAAFGATAASAGTGPSGAQSSGGNAPAVAARVSGPTYLNEHLHGHYSHAAYAPSRFYLVGGRNKIATTGSTYWYSWGKNHAVGSGLMWAQRGSSQPTFVGNVTMRFSDRKTDAEFISTGQRYAYFENVRISGIRPGNGGSVQNWHWSWSKDNWVYGG
jgi:hypothetical protein